MSLRSFFVVASIVAITGASSSASAVEQFPPEIKKTLNLSYEPPCRLCHIQNITGSGTLQTSFAMAMRARGLTPDDRASLPTALAAMRADKVDSDGDGVLDVDELVAGTDPTSPVPGAKLQDDPTGGCATGRAPAKSWWFVVPLLIAVAGQRRRAIRDRADRRRR